MPNAPANANKGVTQQVDANNAAKIPPLATIDFFILDCFDLLLNSLKKL
jgi:hypothetical protein